MKNGYFGNYGGSFVPETLIKPLRDLQDAFETATKNKAFMDELGSYLRNYIGRPTPLSYAARLTQEIGGAHIYLKREDLAHTGSHKINNAIAQALLAKYMGKSEVVAETGAGQHGVATATACALLGLKCTIYMGEIDMQRQKPNVDRIHLLGAKVVPVKSGAKTLKDAVSEAMRHWITHIKKSYYLLGSALGPHPYPTIVRTFQKVIGEEAITQTKEACGSMPHALIACVGGGSNAIGLFYPFLGLQDVKMIGVEAGGPKSDHTKHAARFIDGKIGVFQGTKTILLQDEHGQTKETHSISAGLDYPAIGPEHAALNHTGRVQYVHISDEEALSAAHILSQTEGIIPAIESAHAIAQGIKEAKKMKPDQIIVINLSGRGDKDMQNLSKILA